MDDILTAVRQQNHRYLAEKKENSAATPGSNALAGVTNPQVMEVKPEARVTRSVIAPRNWPLCARFHSWGERAIWNPSRFKRLVFWAWRLMPRIAEFLSVVTSKRVAADVHHLRNVECWDCSNARVRLRVVKGSLKESYYCQRCGCPDWFASELRFKNRFSGWKCPIRKHDGAYPEEAWEDRAVDLSGGVVQNSEKEQPGATAAEVR